MREASKHAREETGGVADGSFYVGVDVGGTNIEGGLMTADGRILSRLRCATEPGQGQDAVLERIARIIRGTIADAGVPESEVAAVGIGNPGLVDPVNGISLDAVNLGWKNVPTAAWLSERLQLPVYVENDVKTYAFGEAMFGAGAGFEHVFGVTVGTGLASAFIINGRIFGGGAHLAGEFGHIPFDEIPYVCKCGLTGCLETTVSATGIARQAADAVRAGRGGLLASRFPDPEAITARDVSIAFVEGDPAAVEVLTRTGELLGKALASVVPVLSPDVIVVGGGGAQAGDALLGPAIRVLRSRLLPAFAARLQVRQASLGNDAGIIGNAYYAKTQNDAFQPPKP